MSSKPPPVPPAGRSDKGPGGPAQADDGTAKLPKAPNNVDEQGDHANVKQNTHNPGAPGNN